MKTKFFAGLSVLMVSMILAAATPPALINYQGVLRDGTGTPRNGNFDMVFRFYSAQSGGTLLLTDTHNSGAPSGQVAVSSGLFTVQLGAGTIAAGSEPNLAEMFRDNAAVWLEIQVAAETLSPRVQVTASAYAHNATSLQGVVNVDGSGNVGVGQVIPGFKLDVGGRVRVRQGSSGSAGIYLYQTTPSLDEGFVGMYDNGKMGFWGRTAGWSFIMDGVTGKTGLGTTAPQNRLDVEGGAAIGAAYSGTSTAPSNGLIVEGNMGLGTTTPGFPLTFPDTTGDKISLWGQSGNHFGLGVQGSLLQVHTDSSTSDIALGYGNSGAFTERMRIKGNGNVGIGTNDPQATLDVQGTTRLFGAYEVVAEGQAFTAMTDGILAVLVLAAEVAGEGGVAFGTKQTDCMNRWTAGSASVSYSAGIISNSFSMPVSKGECFKWDSYQGNFTYAPSYYAHWIPIGHQTGSTLAPCDWNMGCEKAEDLTAPAPPAIVDSGEKDHRPRPIKARGDLLNISSRVAVAGQADPIQSLKPLDLFPVCEPVEYGDVLVTNPAQPGTFCLNRLPADPGVFGIVTGTSAPAPRIESSGLEMSQVPVAVNGVAYCKVDAAYGPINLNDLLCASATPGHAMKAPKPSEQGTVIGKALEPLESGTGIIKVLVMPR